MRDSFIFYRSFYEGIKDLSEEEKPLVIMNIMKHEFEEEKTDGYYKLQGVANGVFSLIRQQLDANNLRQENGQKGGRPKTNGLKKEEKEKNQKKKNKELYIYTQGESSHESNKVHFAEYVSMTNDEYEKLVATHGKVFADQCIEVLDNYKGASGKKYKSDYRAILNWVVDRVKQRGTSFTRERNSEAEEKERLREQAKREWGMTQ